MWYILCYVWCWVQAHCLLAPHPQGWNYRHHRTRCILEVSNGRTTLLKSNIYPQLQNLMLKVLRNAHAAHQWFRWVAEADTVRLGP